MKRVDVTYAVISHDAFFQTTLQEQLNDKGNFYYFIGLSLVSVEAVA